MRKIGLILRFYTSFAPFSLAISLALAYVFYSLGLTLLAPLFWGKQLTLLVIYYFVNDSKMRNYYYYYLNLGLSKKRLWLCSLMFDDLIFILLMIIAAFIG